MRRLAIKALVALLATCMPLIAVATPAHADSTADQFLARINGLRASKGLRALRVDATLSAFAQSWTDHMASANSLSHNPQLANSPGDWTKAGENVGVGAAVDSLFDAFVASPHHYENLVDPSFTIVGIGVTVVNGTLWTTHDFEARSTATVAPKPVTSTTVATRTAPVAAVPAAAPRPTSGPAAATAPPTTARPVATTTPPPPPAPVSVNLTVQDTQPVPVPARIRFSLDQSRGVDPIL